MIIPDVFYYWYPIIFSYLSYPSQYIIHYCRLYSIVVINVVFFIVKCD